MTKDETRLCIKALKSLREKNRKRLYELVDQQDVYNLEEESLDAGLLIQELEEEL